jgi:hypothetical protein
MRQAADRFHQAAQDNPTILLEDLRPREIVSASRNLEGTYLIRLFAEFETGARHYWNSRWDTEPRTVDLLNGLAARCLIPDTQRDNGHLVREYRNTLVHEREDEIEPLTISAARSHLCIFFRFLPHQW